VNLNPFLGWCAVILVYQRPDWPFFINEVALNAGSIYGDLAIAQAKSTP
jgi:hypothetical protein